MNSLYRFDVRVLMPGDTEGFASAAIEAPATLTMFFGDAPVRLVHGLIARCHASGRETSGAAMHMLRLVPRAARMKLRRSSRIFQDQTTREIVEHLLGLSGVVSRWTLSRTLPTRPYCVQYDETD